MAITHKDQKKNLSTYKQEISTAIAFDHIFHKIQNSGRRE